METTRDDGDKDDGDDDDDDGDDDYDCRRRRLLARHGQDVSGGHDQARRTFLTILTGTLCLSLRALRYHLSPWSFLVPCPHKLSGTICPPELSGTICPPGLFWYHVPTSSPVLFVPLVFR